MQFLVMFAEKKRSPRNIFVQIKQVLPPLHRDPPPKPPWRGHPIDSHLKSLPMIIERNSLEFATNVVVTFPLKYVSRLIPVSINIICRYPFSL